MSSLQKKQLDEEIIVQVESDTRPKKPGWKALPYILGNDTIEKLAKFGTQTNFMVYLTRVYNLDQVFAANILNTWCAFANVMPIIGAFVADAYFGKFLTIALASFANIMGMAIITLTAWVPQFHPFLCSIPQQFHDGCNGPTNFQLGVLLWGFFWLAIGTGGIGPCSIPFAIDQFDLTTAEGRQGTRSFYNLYFVIQTLLLSVSVALVVKIQDSLSWTLGFALLTMLMIISIIFFFHGTKFYAYVEPEGSIFSSIAQVIVAAIRKRHFNLFDVEDTIGTFYDPQLKKDKELKLPITKEFRFLNKAALIVDNELNEDGSRSNPWRLCSIQQVEELKCLLKIMPIWITGFIAFIPNGQLPIFSASQATKIDGHMGHNFEIPPGSLIIITMLTIVLVIPFYDKVLSPALAKITNQEGGLTTLQRIGIGHAFGILTMMIAGIVEHKRREIAISLGEVDGVAPMSIMWLAPQFITLAFAQGFSIVGQTEFFNKESPNNMRSIGNSLLSLQAAIASNLSSFIVNIIHSFSGSKDQPDWLDNDVNKGRLDYFYYIIAGLGMLNLCCFIFCARCHKYKSFVKVKA